ncbi:MAG: stage V sporulation protein AE [Oscillospiraceae bacterium]|jgi:stage V sporulation protein AE|nr:stage V sporulation protein AE [Oscillospiraceae bacterium]
MMFIKAFLVGGVLCAIGEILILKTSLTPARILVGYVTCGVALGAVGLYGPLAEWAGAGATVPLTGFGYALAKGAMEGVSEHGLLGAFTGGVSATAGGVAAAIFFGYLCAIIFKPKTKT